MKFLWHFVSVLLYFTTRSEGFDPFEGTIPRLTCLERKHPGCNRDFTSVYTELSMSVTNTTKADTFVYLFTRDNQEDPEPIHRCGGRLPYFSKFRLKKPIYVMIHGYLDGLCKNVAHQEIKDEMLKRGDFNVILVDYSWAGLMDYSEFVENARRIISKQIAIMLMNIQQQTHSSSDDIHLIGHSAGAQIAGLAGQLFEPRLGRITGLDPAGPSFHEDVPIDQRLDRSDAKVVDIVHTNAGPCFPYLGINYDAGHADFYVNDGSFQPSCVSTGIELLLKMDVYHDVGTLLFTACSHVQVLQYYKITINLSGCVFIGVRCNTTENFLNGGCNNCGKHGRRCAIMGFDFDPYGRRWSSTRSSEFHVKTSSLCPYCDNGNLDLNGFKT